MSDNIHQISHPVKRLAEEEEAEGDTESEAEMGLFSGSDRPTVRCGLKIGFWRLRGHFSES